MIRVLQALEHRDPQLQKVKTRNGYRVTCPTHHDTAPSLEISQGEDGRVLLNCFASCSTESILESLGLAWSDLFPQDGAETATPHPNSRSPGAGTTPSARASKPAGPSDQRITEAWDKAVAYGATLCNGGQSASNDPAWIHLAERRLAEGVQPLWGEESLVGVFPRNGEGLPRGPAQSDGHRKGFREIAGRGYRIVGRLFDARTGKLTNLQARLSEEGSARGPSRNGRKCEVPLGSRVAGTVFANARARSLIAGTSEGTDHSDFLILGEGLTDFVALSLSCPARAVMCLPGTSNVKSVMGSPTPSWLRDGLTIRLAFDADEAGEKASADADRLARKAGARVAKVRWPEGCNDAADVLEGHGRDAVARAIEEAPESVSRLLAQFERANELLAREVEKPESLLGDGLLSVGDFGLLYGPPGAGKTWSVLSLALALADGRCWFGIAGPDRPLRVGCLVMEVPEYFLKQRMERLVELAGGDLTEALSRIGLLYRPRFKGAVDLIEEGHQEELKDFCQRLQLDLIIIDPLSRVHSADEKDASRFAPVLIAIEEIRLETGTAILLSHHVRKEQGSGGRGNVLDEIRGTSRLQSDPTLIMRLAPFRGAHELSFPKPNFAAQPEPIYLRRLTEGGFQVTEAPEKASDAKLRRKSEVLEAVRTNPSGLSAAEVKEVIAAQVALPTIKRDLAALRDEGLVEVVGKGTGSRWFPGESSQKVLSETAHSGQ